MEEEEGGKPRDERRWSRCGNVVDRRHGHDFVAEDSVWIRPSIFHIYDDVPVGITCIQWTRRQGSSPVL